MNDSSQKESKAKEKKEKEKKKKNLSIIIALASLISSIPVILVVVLFITVAIVLGLIKTNTTAIASTLSTTYLECNSVNVSGTLYSLEDYVAGVVSHEAYQDGGEEALKAQAIAARTYVIYNSNNCSSEVSNSTRFQTFDKNPNSIAKAAAESTAGMVLTYNGELFSSQYDSFCYEDDDCPDSKKNDDGSYTVTYTKLPNNEKHTITLSDPKQYSRIVPAGGHASGMSQLVSYQLASEGKTYQQILAYFYSDGVQISSLTAKSNGDSSQGSAASGTTYTSSNGHTYINYKQTDYKEDIYSEGCGITSAAIIISAYNTNVTPQTCYDNFNYFSISGNLKKYNIEYKYAPSGDDVSISKAKDELVSHLKSGGTAILRVPNGCTPNGEKWTSSQHFIAVLDYDSTTDKVFISNPIPTASQNGWISLDTLSCVRITWLTE